MDVDEIEKYKSQQEQYHSIRIKDQKKAQKYYDDDFDVNIKDPEKVTRVGDGAYMVDNIVEHITTAKPQVSREPHKKTEKAKESAIKVANFLDHVLDKSIEEIDEGIKNQLLRGENWWQVEYNVNYDKTNPDSLPINLYCPDPLIVLGDAYEVKGEPSRVIKSYQMPFRMVKELYPDWKNPRRKKTTDMVDFLFYLDPKEQYFSADKEPLLDPPISPNLLGFVTLVHSYSGLGKRSTKPENRAVNKLKNSMGLIKQICENESSLDSIIKLWASPYGVFTHTQDNVTLTEDIEQIDLSPGHNIEVPFGMSFDVHQGSSPPAEMFARVAQLRGRLGLDAPPLMSGAPSGAGASGRREDILAELIKEKYEKLINNFTRALAKALGMYLRILDKTPGLLPITIRATKIIDGQSVRLESQITKEDIDGYYECSVKLEPDEAIKKARNAMLYRALAKENRVSWKTMLMKGLGYSEVEADEEINETLAEMAWKTNPVLLEMVLQEAAEEAGMGQRLAELKQRMQQQGEGTQPRNFVTQEPGSSGAVRQMTNESNIAREQPDTGGLF